MTKIEFQTESILGAIFKRKAIKDRMLVKELQNETIDGPDDLQKLVGRAREELRFLISDLTKVHNALKERDPNWDGTFINPVDKNKITSDKNEKPENDKAVKNDEKNSRPEKKKQESVFPKYIESRGHKVPNTIGLVEYYNDTLVALSATSSTANYLEAAEGKIKSMLVRMAMPKNIWYCYFYSESKYVSKIMSNLKKGDVTQTIDDYFPKTQREKLNYHQLLFQDINTIKKRGNSILDNVEKLLSLHGELDSDQYEKTRKVVFAWAYRGFESFPRFERVILSLIARYVK